MGIQGLLPFLKDIVEPVHISQLAGCSVGIDAYSWLHKGAFSCSEELALGIATSRHIDYCLQKIKLLLHHKVSPVLVFDGGLLPSKLSTEEKRKLRRESNLTKAKALINDGNHAGARKFLQKAVDITPQDALMFIEAAKALQPDIRYVISPYEADAQLAYMCRLRMIDAVISEDSDLLVFGCRRVLFKMDSSGNAEQVLGRDVLAYLRFKASEFSLFQQMCILSGCDYVSSIPGIGIKNAHKLLLSHRDWKRVVRQIRHDGKKHVPKKYEEEFERAYLTFQHQTVYDSEDRKCVPLHPLPLRMVENLSEHEAYLGKHHPPALAEQIAKCVVHPDTYEVLPQVCLNKSEIKSTTTSWSRSASFDAANGNSRSRSRSRSKITLKSPPNRTKSLFSYFGRSDSTLKKSSSSSGTTAPQKAGEQQREGEENRRVLPNIEYFKLKNTVQNLQQEEEAINKPPLLPTTIPSIIMYQHNSDASDPADPTNNPSSSHDTQSVSVSASSGEKETHHPPPTGGGSQAAGLTRSKYFSKPNPSNSGGSSSSSAKRRLRKSPSPLLSTQTKSPLKTLLMHFAKKPKLVSDSTE